MSSVLSVVFRGFFEIFRRLSGQNSFTKGERDCQATRAAMPVSHFLPLPVARFAS